MKRLTLEEIKEYKERYEILAECDCNYWDEACSMNVLLKKRFGILLTVRFMKQMGMDVKIPELPKHKLEEIEEEMVGDYLYDYNDVMCSLVNELFNWAGWEISLVEVEYLLKDYFLDLPDGELIVDDYDNGCLEIKANDVKNMWNERLKDYFAENSLLNSYDFAFIEEQLYNAVKVMLNGSNNYISYINLYKNRKLGCYLYNINFIKHDNHNLMAMIFNLLESAKFPYHISVPSFCKYGITNEHCYMIEQSSYYYGETGEQIDDSMYSIHSAVSAVLLHQALLLAEEEQPGLFVDYRNVDKVGLYATVR